MSAFRKVLASRVIADGAKAGIVSTKTSSQSCIKPTSRIPCSQMKHSPTEQSSNFIKAALLAGLTGSVGYLVLTALQQKSEKATSDFQHHNKPSMIPERQVVLAPALTTSKFEGIGQKTPPKSPSLAEELELLRQENQYLKEKLYWFEMNEWHRGRI